MKSLNAVTDDSRALIANSTSRIDASLDAICARWIFSTMTIGVDYTQNLKERKTRN